MDDGKITTDELKSLGLGFGKLGNGRGNGGLPGLFGGKGWKIPAATPAPTSGSNG